MNKIQQFFILLVTTSSCLAKPLFLYHSRFQSTRGPKGVVAAQEQQAAHVGVNILRIGGNAVDAAVATGFALMVTLPRAGALGGGGFMTLWLQKKHQALVIDYRESAPAHLKAAQFLNPNGSVNRQKATRTGLAVGVPGTLAGLCLAEKKYGKLGLKTVINPAINLASHGIIVTQGLAEALKSAAKNLKKDPNTWALFTNPQGHLVQQGDRLRRPQLARTLRLIQKKGPAVFYTGSVAKAIVATVEHHHGVMDLNDLKEYRAILRQPLSLAYHNATVLAPPAPASGLTLLELLKMAATFPLNPKSIPQNSAQEFHLLTEMMNFAFYDRNRFLSDPKFSAIPVQTCLSDKHIQSMVKRISSRRHLPSNQISPQGHPLNEGINTTHFSVVDRQGNVVSNTYSLNYSFGSGISVAGYGILLNNTIDDFSLAPGVANAYGLIQGKANQIQPGKRPVSSMTPIIVVRHQQAWLATGSPGGSRIITSVFQLLINIMNYHLGLAAATERPRIHSQLYPDQVSVEDGISPDTLRLLRKWGHTVVASPTQGSLQSVMRTDQGLFGFADTRRLGAGVAQY